MNEQVISYLEKYPEARLRANRYKAITNLLLRNFSLWEEWDKTGKITLDKKTLAEMLKESDTLNRAFRQVQSQRKDIAGDYEEFKDVLEARKLDELGY